MNATHTNYVGRIADVTPSPVDPPVASGSRKRGKSLATIGVSLTVEQSAALRALLLEAEQQVREVNAKRIDVTLWYGSHTVLVNTHRGPVKMPRKP